MPRHIGNDVHDVTVTLDLHHLGHTHRAEIRNSTNIVAGKIDKHDVFRALLWIGEEFGGVALILRNRRAARTGSCDRANLDHVAHEADVHFRRTADESEIIGELEAEHVWRRIDETETPVKIERVPIEIGFETLR